MTSNAGKAKLYGNFIVDKETLATGMAYLDKTRYLLYLLAAIVLIQGILAYQSTGNGLLIGTHGFTALLFALSGFLTTKQPLAGIWFSVMYYVVFLISDYRSDASTLYQDLPWKAVIFVLLIVALVIGYKGYNILKKKDAENVAAMSENED